MKNTTDAAAPAETATEAPAQLVCTVLVNGIVIGDAHHAVNKVMILPEAQAKALAALNPPGVRIDGVA
jgi:hypothetical protein